MRIRTTAVMAPSQTQASVDEKAKGADIGGIRAEGLISAAGSQGTWQMGGNPPIGNLLVKVAKRGKKWPKLATLASPNLR